MKDDYRETSSGKTVKYDSDPTNDYSDGYNAGRRYEEPTPPKKNSVVGLANIITTIVAACIVPVEPTCMAVGKGASSKNTPTVTPSAAPGVVPGSTPAPGSSVKPTVSPSSSPSPSMPATLPAVGTD